MCPLIGVATVVSTAVGLGMAVWAALRGGGPLAYMGEMAELVRVLGGIALTSLCRVPPKQPQLQPSTRTAPKSPSATGCGDQLLYVLTHPGRHPGQHPGRQ